MSYAHAIIVSTRGIPLALDNPPSFPCLAVEMYCKWYGLYLVQGSLSSCTVMAWRPDTKDEAAANARGSWIFGDHVFNPAELRKITKPAPIDSRSWELIVGRYVTDYLEDKFPEMQMDLYHHETTTKQGTP